MLRSPCPRHPPRPAPESSQLSLGGRAPSCRRAGCSSALSTLGEPNKELQPMSGAEPRSRLTSGVRRGKVAEEVVEEWRARGQTACRCRRNPPRGVNVSPPPGTATARSHWRAAGATSVVVRGGAPRRPEPRYADRHNSARHQHECCNSGHLCGERATICREGGRPIACSPGRRAPDPGRGTATLCRPA